MIEENNKGQEPKEIVLGIFKGRELVKPIKIIWATPSWITSLSRTLNLDYRSTITSQEDDTRIDWDFASSHRHHHLSVEESEEVAYQE